MELEWTYLDTWIVTAGVLSAVSCSLVGNFMVLRRLSMMGDAISHAVLPGLAVAFLLSGSRDSVMMFVGAAIVGILTAVFTQSIHQFGKVEQSASMGIVFTTLFAIGLVMIVRAADSVDLDPGCVLYGAIEMVPLDTQTVFNHDVPQAVITLSGVLIINLIFVTLFFKELRISAFDPELATTLGINSQLMHYALMTLTAITAVAAFESVGSILVIAMLIVPAAVAHLLTDRLATMVVLSALVGAACAVLGHVSAITVPSLWGFSDTSTAGMMAVAAGFLLGVAMIFAPRHGILSKLFHRFSLSVQITREDILGLLYRISELESSNETAPLPAIPKLLKASSGVGQLTCRLALIGLQREGKVSRTGGEYQLTDRGRYAAGSLIRSHRLWEMYLYKTLNQPIEELHFSAEQLEHVTDAQMQDRLADSMDSPPHDPHGRSIPPRRAPDSKNR